MGGFVLGETVDVDRYLLPIVAAIIALSLLPVVREMLRARSRRPIAEGEERREGSRPVG